MIANATYILEQLTLHVYPEDLACVNTFLASLAHIAESPLSVTIYANVLGRKLTSIQHAMIIRSIQRIWQIGWKRPCQLVECSRVITHLVTIQQV